ncbi:helix-turn-helix protein [Streptomyces sp. Amel2xB2]|nr:helix-turn-helix protein [Streptomyces sp. Amel2xB2]
MAPSSGPADTEGAGSGWRVPGLRREEVAVLAGVSADYYTRLEQGRERNPSAHVLAAIAKALRLSPDARGHLFRLGGLNPCLAPDATRARVHPKLLELLDAFPHAAAYVLGPAFDVFAANPVADALLSPFGDERNMTRILFTRPEAKSVFAEWDRLRRSTVEALRLNQGRMPDDPDIDALVNELAAVSPEFQELWAEHRVGGLSRAFKVFVHLRAGRIELMYQTFDVCDAPGRAPLHTRSAPHTFVAPSRRKCALPVKRSRMPGSAFSARQENRLVKARGRLTAQPSVLLQFLGEHHKDAAGTADVRELVDVLIIRDAAKRTASVPCGCLKGFVEVVDGEGDAMHTDLVGKSGLRLDRLGVDVLEELKATVAVRGLEHRDVGVIAVKADGGVGPFATDRVTSHDRETEVGEKGDRCFEIANGDADVLKSDGHALHATEPDQFGRFRRRPGCARRQGRRSGKRWSVDRDVHATEREQRAERSDQYGPDDHRRQPGATASGGADELPGG